MNIITVIPLTRSKVADELSYFTASEAQVGAIVTVPLRSKTIHGIVSSLKDAADMKIDIKNAPFEIRKLGKVKSTVFFPSQFMNACKELASYYACTPGAVIDALIADGILESAAKIPPPLPKQTSFMTGAPARDATFAIQGDDADRFSSWRSLIRQEFARKRSIVFYAPTIEDCENIYRQLEKGIEGYIFILNGSLTKKKMVDTWNKISNVEHPIVVIATGSFSALPRSDIETVIIEREHSRGWINQKAPYLDLRHALETIARARKQTVFIADSLLRSETLFRLDQNDIDRGSPFKWRSISNAIDTMVNMKKDPDAVREIVAKSSGEVRESSFQVLSPELESLIRLNQEENTHLFLMTIRRGSAPTTVCGDCESIVTCRNCDAPVVLHTSAESGKNFFLCHKCGERRSADETCVNCGSWRLTPLGIGIERVREELRAKFPSVDVFQIDSDSTKSNKHIDEALTAFRNKPGSILLGTELAMLHFTDKIDHIAVVSLDSLFSLPDFRIQEKIMYMLTRLRTQATRSIMVQTRKPEEKVFEYGLKGNLSDFYRQTLIERKQFAYPPFAHLIKLTIEGKKDTIARLMSEAQSSLEPRELEIFPAFTSAAKGNSAIHGLMRLEYRAWPDPDIIAKLKALPPQVSVKINPETLL